MSNKNFDNCVSFYLEDGMFVGRLVRLNTVLEEILSKHDYPLNVSAALAETTSLSVLLSAALKYDGLFTLQIQGNGPISLLVSDVTSTGNVRSCARFDEEKLQKAKILRKTEKVVEELPHLVGGGYLAFTIDQGIGSELYQGVVDLQGKTLTEAALRYFKQSEQIDTILKLFIKRPEGESPSWLSAGIVLQKVPLKGGASLPDQSEHIDHIWEDAGMFIASLSDNEVFNADLTSGEILHRLFHANNLRIGETKAYRFKCRCSRDKLKRTLSSFKPEEIDSMVKDGHITATCNFCSAEYIFDRNELASH